MSSSSFNRFSLRRISRMSKKYGWHKRMASKSESGEHSGGVPLAGLRSGGSGGGGAGSKPAKVPFGLTEVDDNSLDELSRFEPPVRPPSLAQIQQLTGHRFSEQWLKYIYNRFKNECPTGRMKFADFRRLFGTFIPDRISDAYLERMFCAFCQQNGTVSQSHVDYLTFQDLVVSLYRLCDENARGNAEWTMRLIGAGTTQQPQQQSVTFGEFFEFVRSVFTLNARGDQSERKRNAGSLLIGGAGDSTGRSGSQRRGSATARKATVMRSAAMFASAITAPTAGPAIAHFGNARSSPNGEQDAISKASEQRAIVLFKELDTDEKGFLTTNDFEQFFADQRMPLVFVS